MKVTGLDHVVVVCRDPSTSLAFYASVLGLEPTNETEWRAGSALFPSVRVDDHTIIDLLPGEPSGRNVDHLCLTIEPTDLQELARRPDLDVVEGPVVRSGARGDGWSLYIRDPDGHLLELKQYGVDAAGDLQEEDICPP